MSFRCSVLGYGRSSRCTCARSVAWIAQHGRTCTSKAAISGPGSALAHRLTELPAEATGANFTGGEPLIPATAPTCLVDSLRARRD